MGFFLHASPKAHVIILWTNQNRFILLALTPAMQRMKGKFQCGMGELEVAFFSVPFETSWV